MSILPHSHPPSYRCLPLRSCLFLLLLLLLACPALISGQTCNRNSCSPDQGSLPQYPANSCDACTSGGSCANAYYSMPGFSCGNATLSVDGAVTLQRTQCCPFSFDGEDEFVCVSERHSEEDGTVNGYSCVKIGAMVSLLRVGMLIGAAVCLVMFAATSLCVWRFCIKVPEQRFILPQYRQPLVDSGPLPSLPSQPASAYQPPAPHVPLLSEHRPQYDQPSDIADQ